MDLDKSKLICLFPASRLCLAKSKESINICRNSESKSVLETELLWCCLHCNKGQSLKPQEWSADGKISGPSKPGQKLPLLLSACRRKGRWNFPFMAFQSASNPVVSRKHQHVKETNLFPSGFLVGGIFSVLPGFLPYFCLSESSWCSHE